MHINDLNEVTSAIVRKGKNGETVKRHVHSLIPYMSLDNPVDNPGSSEAESNNQTGKNRRGKRKAALDSEAKSRAMLNDE